MTSWAFAKILDCNASVGNSHKVCYAEDICRGYDEGWELSDIRLIDEIAGTQVERSEQVAFWAAGERRHITRHCLALVKSVNFLCGNQ